jgi:hypothetical protein
VSARFRLSTAPARCYRLGVETGTASCFAPLAADRPRRRPFARLASPLKTRVRGFCRSASGRYSSRHGKHRKIATGCGVCGYKTASGRGKWPNTDPISDKGFFSTARPRFEMFRLNAKDYKYLFNQPTCRIDADGLWQVCCRNVRWDPNEDNWLDYWIYKAATHCDLRNGPPDSGGDSTCYPVVKDPNNEVCGNTDKCLQRNGYNAGSGQVGDNCQSNTIDRLKKCGLRRRQ